MLRHRGKNRTFHHNLRLATLLSFIAGMVNICGVLALGTLTTNVTGHFAFFAEELSLGHYNTALAYISFILAFLSGAFLAGLLTEWTSMHKPHQAHILPMLSEIILLSWVVYTFNPGENVVLPAWALLFAMGMQNSLVTRISNAVVRTTHLTGLFTDLGIELSQLFFYRKSGEQQQLQRGILLKTIIISGFFTGGLAGGFLYSYKGIKSLQLAILILVFALFYDNIRYRWFFLSRKIKNQ